MACEVRCERGYWIQACGLRPGRPVVRRHRQRHLRLGLRRQRLVGSRNRGIRPGHAGRRGRARTPPSLILRGTGDPFRVDAENRATTLVIDAKVSERDGRPLGDRIADVPIVFRLYDLQRRWPWPAVAEQWPLPGRWVDGGRHRRHGRDGRARHRVLTGGPAVRGVCRRRAGVRCTHGAGPALLPHLVRQHRHDAAI